MLLKGMATGIAGNGEKDFEKRLKKRVLIGFLLMIPGILLAYIGITGGATAEHSSSFMNGYVTGAGFGILFSGLITAIKTLRILNNPEKLKALRIRETDERSIEVNRKAMAMACFLTLGILFAATIIVGIINFESLVFVTLFAVMVVSFFVWLGCYFYFNKTL